ncbi:inositol polyphosphate multikinase [Purpureocillium lilacinum]|uniref:Kinase n=2 Tax=Purpureocillium lilacinum TaxID=33203 RepID=A0A179HZV5_PURLI|nr:inositol polyphosphate multikinase [Purpureocillium lilacinum]KAK4092903.1 hypothetical protein Purlil1_2828 [Purpureocillium lilacinum]OAQ87463.1 inositol polyphosphate multikinase [Purpureocillium lilacinum]OAQ95422.1 inositol polyphosphate multikinase [Purpureocillium lilacinum]PWI71483.1 arginine metabolism regulation protein iii [Purpureocillium lilacinum]GJN66373.1 hypothetical protein PLICBS_000391 [Purpureocillium lilacinum]
MVPKELPTRDQLRDYNYAVAGHAGTLCDAEGELFIKPCTQSEIDFYQSANRRHPDFAELMPLFMGSLMLSDPTTEGIDDAIAGVISDSGDIKTTKEQIVASVAQQIKNAPLDLSEPSSESQSESQSEDNISWIPTKGKKIKTDKAVVLENATFGFKQANILDAKLGVRLWADDAPLEKKRRFDKISSETTHGNLGFRIAGMRVYRGSEDPSDLDEEDYKIYDKDYGRLSVNDENVVDEFRKFVFNKAAGIDEELGKAVCAAFARDLKRVVDVMSRHESRMFSSSLLFVFEGDGEALRKAIEENNALVESAVEEKVCLDRTTSRIDSGIGLDDSDSDDLEELEVSLPQIYTLKMIDFAHAQWTPGLGPDKNILTGVRSLERIFQEMAQ